MGFFNNNTSTGGGGGGGASGIPPTGSTTKANSLPVTIATDDALPTAFGTQSDTAATSDNGLFSFMALIKRLLGKLPALVNGRIPVDGSGVTQPVSLASLPAFASTPTVNLGTIGSAMLDSTGQSIKTRLDESLGQNGSVYTNNTTAVTGTFVAIYVIADAVFSSFTSSNITGTLTGDTFPTGTAIYGNITGYTLTSGKVLAIKA